MKKIIMLCLIIGFTIISCKTKTTIYVADYLTKCHDHTAEKCLLIKANVKDEWTIYSDKINGFKHQEGHTYKLNVLADHRNDLTTFTLIEILSDSITKPDTQTMKKANTIEHQKWVVHSLTGFDINNLPKLYFTIEQDKINGFSGCNQFSGPIELSKQGLFKTGVFITTRRACADTNELEHYFLSAFNTIESYDITNGMLKLFDGKKHLIISCQAKSEETPKKSSS